MRDLRVFAVSLAICLAFARVAAGQTDVQGCEPGMFLNRTATTADRSLTWSFSIASDPERCLQIRAGQQVVWNGSFGAHPLDPQGGDTPNPIAGHQDGVVTFLNPGTYGYECGAHAIMKGAIRVVAAAAPTAVPAGRRAFLLPTFLLLCVLGAVVTRRWRRDRHAGF